MRNRSESAHTRKVPNTTATRGRRYWSLPKSLTVNEAIDAYRHAAQAIRGINARDGHTRATLKAIESHEADQAQVVRALEGTDYRNLVGVLIEEEELAERLRIARRSGETRPELVSRLKEAREFLRAFKALSA